MNKLHFKRVLVALTLMPLLVLGYSCVNQEYDMSDDRLNLEITAFEEGLTLPLGNTENIYLNDLLTGVDTTFFNCGDDGIYSVNFRDTLDMTDQLAEMTDMIEIPDVDFVENISFELDQFDISDVKLEAEDYPFEQVIDVASAPEIDIPSFNENIEVAAGMAEYAPDPSQMVVPVPPFGSEGTLIRFPDDYSIGGFALSDIPADSPLLNETTIPLPLDQVETDEVVEVTGNVKVSVVLPDGIESVKEITLNPNARINVSFELGAGLLYSGEIVPDVTMDLSSIFNIAGSSDNIINLASDLSLNSTNGYSAEKDYMISSLIVNESDWSKDDVTGELVLSKEIEIPVTGTLDLSGLETTTKRIYDSRKVEMVFNVEVVDLEIADVALNIEPIVKEEPRSVDVSASIYDIPAEILSIRNVEFTDASGISLSISAANLADIEGLDVEFTTLEIDFPEEYIVEGANAENKVIYENVDLASGLDDHIKVTGINLPEIENGAIVINNTINIDAVVTASGTVHSKDLPEDEAHDVKVNIDVVAQFDIKDYQVEIDDYYYALDIPSEEIKIELPAELAEQEMVTVYPQGNPVLSIEISIPELPMATMPADEGISIFFPEMIRFDEAELAQYNFDPETNSIYFSHTDQIPELIEMPVSELWIIPELDETDNKYYARGEVKIVGGVSIEGGFVNKAEIEELSGSDKVISVVAHVPEIIPQYLDIDVYKADVSEVVPLEIMKPEDVPAELLSVGVIDVENAILNIEIDASELPELGSDEASLSVDLDIQLPSMVIAKGADKDGVLTVRGEMKGDHITIDPVEIEYLDLTGIDIKKNGISGDVNVTGVIKLNNALLEIDQWLGRELNVEFKASMIDIIVSEINAYVDYRIDPVEEKVDLGDIAGMINEYGVDAVLDFNRAFITVAIQRNLGIPIEAEMELVPVRKGQPDVANTISASLTLQPTASAEDMETTVFYIANTNERMPEGCEFVQADILGLLRDIPESFEIRLTANTDTDRECVLEPMATYVLKVDYQFYLPLEFGEDFSVDYATQLSGLPPVIGEILSTGVMIKLGGEITNSLPLCLDLEINFLDAEGNIVPLVEGAGVQNIKSCDAQGNPTSTPLEIFVKMQEGAQAEITTLQLSFNADAGDAVGVPVTNEAFLYAKINAILPEGITVDVKDLVEQLNTNE